MTIEEVRRVLISVKYSPIKFRRAWLREMRWSEAQWYERWPIIGAHMETVFRELKSK